MSELKITLNSLENAILKDGNFVNGYVDGNGYISANGYGAHAEGYTASGHIDASGLGAHAEGIETLASGLGAHAEGYETAAIGNYSHAGGFGTIADSLAMTAIGKYNRTSTNAYFVIGNGTVDSSNDAFVVDTNGNVQIGGDITKVNNVSINNNVSIDGNIAKVNNVSIDDSATAKVNNVNNVYLGCPIGTVVMWAGETAPEGWFLCDGSRILYKNNKSIELTIQGIQFKENELYNLTHVIGSKYGSFTVRKATLSRSMELIATGYIKSGYQDGDNFIVNSSTDFTNILSEAYKFYDLLDTSILTDEGYSITIDSSNYTLCLPNFQQKFPLGADNASIGKDSSNLPYDISLGKTGGEDTHELSIPEMPKHKHEVTIYLTNNTGTTTGVVDALSNKNADSLTYSTSYTGDGKSHNNIPPFLAINFIIKYK